MKGKWLGFAVGIVIVAIAVSLRSTPKDAGSLSMPFIDQKLPEESQNLHVPQTSHAPLILLELTNPATRKKVKCVGYLDTGSDQCLIKKEFADRLGLKPDGQPPYEMHAGGGKVPMNSAIIEYTLTGPEGDPIKTFPVQSAPFFISETWLPTEVVLGNIGFLDRFKEVRISYPKQITLICKRLTNPSSF